MLFRSCGASAANRPTAAQRFNPSSANFVVGCKPVPNAWPGSMTIATSPVATVCSRHGGRTTTLPTRSTGKSARQLVDHSSAGMARISNGPMPRRPTPDAENDAKRASSSTSVEAAARDSGVFGNHARTRTGADGSKATPVSPTGAEGAAGSALVPAGARRASRSDTASAASASQATESSSQPSSLSRAPRRSPARNARAPRAVRGSASSAPRHRR